MQLLKIISLNVGYFVYEEGEREGWWWGQHVRIIRPVPPQLDGKILIVKMFQFHHTAYYCEFVSPRERNVGVGVSQFLLDLTGQ